MLSRHLPDAIPVKWDALGHPAKYGGKFAPFYLMPSIIAVLAVATALPYLRSGPFKQMVTALSWASPLHS